MLLIGPCDWTGGLRLLRHVQAASARPGTGIMCIANGELRPLLNEHAGASLQPWPSTSGRWRRALWLARRLRRERFDLCLDLSGQPWVAWLRRMPSTGQWVGAAEACSELERLGFDSPNVHPYRFPSKAQGRVDAFLRATHLVCGYLALHAGQWDGRPWRARVYGGVLRRIGRDWRLPSLILHHGPQQRQAAETAAARSGGHALVAPQWSLAEIGAAMQRAEVVLGHDEAMLELARLAGAPIVAWPEAAGAELGSAGTAHLDREQPEATVEWLAGRCQLALQSCPRAVALRRAA